MTEPLTLDDTKCELEGDSVDDTEPLVEAESDGKEEGDPDLELDTLTILEAEPVSVEEESDGLEALVIVLLGVIELEGVSVIVTV